MMPLPRANRWAYILSSTPNLIFADTRTDWFRNELHQYASRDRFGEIHSFSGYNYERPAILSGVNSPPFGSDVPE